MAAVQRWLPRPALSIFMLGLWLFLAQSISGGHIVLGGILAWAIPLFLQHFWPEELSVRSPVTAIKFLCIVIYDIVVANVVVAKMILTPSHKLQPAFMILPLDIERDFTITLLANTISMTPGTVSVDLSLDRKSLVVHALHVDDIDATLAEIKRRYEAPLKEMFEC